MSLSDVASERAVLAGIMQYGHDCFIDINDVLTESTFTQDCNQVIFKCIKHHFQDSKTNLDFPSIFASAKILNLFQLIDNPDDKKYIKALQNFAVNKDNVRKLAVTIRKLEVARLLRDKLRDCEHEISRVNGSETINEILGLAESAVFDFTNSVIDNNKQELKLLGDGLDEYVDYLISNPNQPVGISSGFPLYDLAIGGGFRRQTVNVVAARLKTGKTTFAINVALHVAGNLNIPVLILDTEMQTKDHWDKSLSYYSNVVITEIERSLFTKNNFKLKKVNDAKQKIKSIPYTYQNVSGCSFEEVLSIARRWIVKKVGYNNNGTTKDCLLIYDYLKLMSDDVLKSSSEHQVLGFQMMSLHNFTVKYDIPCLTFSQSNRDGITKETTDVLAQSDRIAWFGSNISLLKAKTEEEIAEDGPENGNRKLIPLACRHGEGLKMGDYINMQFNGHIATIRECGTRNQLYSSKRSSEFEEKNDAGKIPN